MARKAPALDLMNPVFYSIIFSWEFQWGDLRNLLEKEPNSWVARNKYSGIVISDYDFVDPFEMKVLPVFFTAAVGDQRVGRNRSEVTGGFKAFLNGGPILS